MSVMDILLGWTLSLHPLLAIVLVSVIITLLVNIVYKYTTDQNEMKRLKTRLKELQKEVRAAGKDNPKKAMKLQEEMMKDNFAMMKHSLKASLYTLIPVAFIFFWMNAHFTYAPLAAGEPLTVSAQFVDGFSGSATLTSATLETKAIESQIQVVDDQTVAKFAVNGAAGQHDFTVHYQNFSNNGSVWFSENPVKNTFPAKGPVELITVDYPKVHPLGPVSLFGWQPGWLAIYIILSIALSIGSRKLMKIY